VVGISLFMIYNSYLAFSVGDPLIVYSTLMPFHTVAVLVIGWFFFRSKAANNTSQELVSVIIPIYNQEILIAKVIEAVFQSTYPNIEVIAVNDGSTDFTGKILERLSEKYENLKVIHKLNGGKRTAVAAGFFASKGDYIVLIDSDSVIDGYAIEEFMKTFSTDPTIGGVVGNGKVLNAEKNVLTKCQDSWYDIAFNVNKAMESTFGTVLCCSGCLCAYRREAIARFIPFWAESKIQYGDDRNLTTYAIATPWVKSKLAPVSRKLMRSMASYDDAEDRGLTAQTMMSWKTVYVPTAVAHTVVPETLKQYLRQQVRWKKGFLRSSFFVSSFFWKKNPIISFLFYLELMSAFIAPAVFFSIYIYRPLFYHQYWFALSYFFIQLILGVAVGLDYKLRDRKARNWKYKPVMNLISSFILSWILIPALFSYRSNKWLTR
jgi:hyaluronan synthase